MSEQNLMEKAFKSKKGELIVYVKDIQEHTKKAMKKLCTCKNFDDKKCKSCLVFYEEYGDLI